MKKAGESYRPLVTIVKIKNKVPTVLAVGGRVYVLRPPDQYQEPRKRGGGG